MQMKRVIRTAREEHDELSAPKACSISTREIRGEQLGLSKTSGYAGVLDTPILVY